MALQSTLTAKPITLKPREVTSRLLQGCRTLLTVFASMSEGHQRLKLAERLQAKSDAELARMGLRRDEVVRHAFKGLMFD